MSSKERVVVIAEIGVNHNGSLELAKRLVDEAASAGADYAKFQTFQATKLASADAPVADYQQLQFEGNHQLDLLASLELTHTEFEEIVAHCESAGIGFLTTAHDLDSAAFVFGLDSDFVKVPSGDITNFPFLQLVGRQGKHVLLSTGASNGDEVFEAISVLEAEGLSRQQITVMQCTTEYPAPIKEANLLAMVLMSKKWGVGMGFSDHTEGHLAAVASVALGATVLEKHITLDRSMVGPDHAASLEPTEFALMVSSVRGASAALGSDQKRITSSEMRNREVIRKSIVATQYVSAGEPFGSDNLGVMRPGRGLSPMRWNDVIGSVARRDYKPGEMVDEP